MSTTPDLPGLDAEPWLEPFVADSDTDLSYARLRRLKAQEDYLRRSGDVPHRRHRGDVITTSLDGPSDDEP